MQVLVIVDAKPKDMGLPTDAYYSIEEVHDVSTFQNIDQFECHYLYVQMFCLLFRMVLPLLRLLSMWAVKLELKRLRKWVWNIY